MGATGIDGLVDRHLEHLARFHPVDASFMGLQAGHDRLPPAGRDVQAQEAQSLADLRRDLDRLPPGRTAGARLDARLLGAALTHAQAALAHRPRFLQPSWYSGEVAFGLISLLLPTAPPGAADALARRLDAIPGFLAAGQAQLAGRSAPEAWSRRARRECAAIGRLLADGLPRHPAWREALAAPCRAAAAALARFSAALAALPDADPACGRDYLALLMREVHGLPWTPEEACALAEEAFQRLGESLRADHAGAEPEPPAIAAEDLPRAYARWHETAIARAGELVTPATEYGLEFAPRPDWANVCADDLYFLSYRSPPAFGAGGGSVYWTAPAAQPVVAIKQTHAVHHGSIGHHTQNVRARAASARLARIAGTDCASGIAMLSAGTMVEGWACYATEAMAGIEGFYTGREMRALVAGDHRNAASVLADVRLHTGQWSLARMREFYRDEAGFPAARVEGETTRNSILPATRLMYFLGTEQIKALRRATRLPPRAFHDTLIGFGHVPIAWAAEEMARAGQPAGDATPADGRDAYLPGGTTE
jgi:hypothetical protein